MPSNVALIKNHLGGGSRFWTSRISQGGSLRLMCNEDKRHHCIHSLHPANLLLGVLVEGRLLLVVI